MGKMEREERKENNAKSQERGAEREIERES